MGWLDSIFGGSGSGGGDLPLGGGGGTDAPIPSGGYSLGGSGLDTSGIYGLGGASPAGSPTGYSFGGGGLNTAMPPTQSPSWYSDILGTVGKGAQAILPFLGLGTAGLGLYSGIKGMQQAGETRQQNQQATRTQQQAADTSLQTGQQLTTAGTQAMMGGALPPGLEAQAKQWEDAYRAQVNNYLAKAGMGTSSSAAQWEPYITQQAAIYRQQLASGLLAPGQTGLQTAANAGAQVVGSNQASQSGIGNVLQSANQALYALQAASGQRPQPPA